MGACCFKNKRESGHSGLLINSLSPTDPTDPTDQFYLFVTLNKLRFEFSHLGIHKLKAVHYVT